MQRYVTKPEYQIFLKYLSVKQVFHRFKWSVFSTWSAVVFWKTDIICPFFPKIVHGGTCVDVLTIFGNANRSDLTSIYRSSYMYTRHYRKFFIIKHCSYFESTPQNCIFERMEFKFKVNLLSAIWNIFLSGWTFLSDREFWSQLPGRCSENILWSSDFHRRVYMSFFSIFVFLETEQSK